ncbi:hypothetical protein DFH09DRAFT_1330566 [Mycena vulgaris]|nr:hypothetical protein DFH09DRAFT_1330566 [Mycena vulgaris]
MQFRHSLVHFLPLTPPYYSIFLFVFIPAMGEYDQTIGFTLMGVTVNTYLMGLIMSQFFTYWIAVNTTQAGAVVYMSWFYCVTNSKNPRVVAMLLWPYPFAGLRAILAITNQMLQSWRIYLFTGNKILTGFLLATSVAACGTGVAAAIEAWTFSEQAKLVMLQSIVMVNSALLCAIDVIIAGYMLLVTLILLLDVSSAIVMRSLLLRRRHRCVVEEAIANGTWVPPAPRGLRDADLAPPVNVAEEGYFGSF